MQVPVVAEVVGVGLRRAVAVVLGLALALPLTPAGPVAAETRAPATGAARPEVTALVERPDGGVEVRRSRPGTADEARALAARWRVEKGVRAADVAVRVQAQAVPAPDPRQGEQWGLSAVRAPTAWQARDAAGQVVAVIDSGVQASHPDLAGALTAGYDVVQRDSVPQDEFGHGTHVAGIVAAAAGNGVGGAGAALRAKVMPVRVLDSGGSGWSSDVAEGVVWAVDHGARVINLSLAAPENDKVLAAAVQHAQSKGALVVAAAGNYGTSTPVYPAALSGVVAVGAVDQNQARASFSSTGAHIALAAPGVGILSTDLRGTYVKRQGTSMAAPFVSAAAATVRAAGVTSPPRIVEKLVGSARDLGPAGRDSQYGFGLLDMAGAVSAASTLPDGSPFGSLDVVSAGPGSVRFAGWAIDPGTASPIAVHVYVGTTGRSLSASIPRSDIGRLYPQYGSAHGFSGVVPVGGGTYSACAYAIDVGVGSTTRLGCRTVTVPDGPPFGSLDVVSAGPGGVRFGGWAIDPGTTAPIAVHLYVGRAGRSVSAGLARADIGRLYPAYGAHHGFSGFVPVAGGTYSACAYAINVGVGSTTRLGCRTVTVPDGPPFGSLDSVTGGVGSVRIAGWAVDPGTADPVDVWVWVAGTQTIVRADQYRSDVGRHFPAYGPYHGFVASIEVPKGTHRLCAVAANVGQGTSTSLGCRDGVEVG